MRPDAGPLARRKPAEGLTVSICKSCRTFPPHPENYGGNPPEFRSKIN
jgi:hypothetical protein